MAVIYKYNNVHRTILQVSMTSLHRVTDDWLWKMNDGLVTDICALDIEKCFDTINHDILCNKLEYYGFNQNVVNWFKSYLSTRGHKFYCRHWCTTRFCSGPNLISNLHK